MIVFTPNKPISGKLMHNNDTNTTTKKMLTYNFLCARHSSEHFPSIKLFKPLNVLPESGTIITLFYKLHRVNWHN